jgi:hypothetical protein
MKVCIVRPSGLDSGPILGPSLRTSAGDVMSTAERVSGQEITEITLNRSLRTLR